MPSFRCFLPPSTVPGRAFPSLASVVVSPLNADHRRTRPIWRPLLLASVLLGWLGSFLAPASAKTAMQAYVEAMQPGWNLGNTLDATPTETSWGNPLVTREFIQQIKAQGFNSIRIPVTWEPHMGPGPGYTIDPAWMDRVQQIVDWSLEAGLYVMLNAHHDSVWVRTMPTNHDAVFSRFNALWSQIAPRFRDHSDKLMFESINEPTFDGVDGAAKNALLKELNVSFYNTVRNSGGGNATRPLVLPSVETNNGQEFLDALSETIAELNDPHLIATVHDYGLWHFSVNIGGVTKFDAATQDWTKTGIDAVYNTLVSKGTPVVVGEFGLLSFSGFGGAVERGEAIKFFEYLTSYYQSKGITYQWWDAGAFFNRYTYQWNTPELYHYIMHGVVGRSSTAESDLIFLRDGTPLEDAVINLNLNGNSFLSLDDGATPLVLGSDYMINGRVLTIKASALAAYASGGFGEKTVLTANFTGGGPGWKLRVLHNSAPALAAVSGTKNAVAGLVIPVAFNGDLVATMEARYVGSPNYPYPGPAEWTSYKEFNYSYAPDYTNNTITLKKEFFAATTNDPIELTFHMWSGRKVNYRLTFQSGGGVDGEGQAWDIYQDGLVGWNDWNSWAPHNADNTTVVHSGTAAISVDAGAWGGLVLSYNTWEPVVDTSAYKTLVFWIHGGSVGGQSLGVSLVRGDDWSSPGVSIPAPTANTWTKVEIPLSDLGVEGSANITRIMIQNWTGGDIPTYYVDDIKLTTGNASNLVFVNGAPAPVITSSTTAHGTFNSSFTYATTAINNALSFSATGLPPGLAIDANTGVISGTPTSAGSYSVSLGASNVAGTGTETLVMTIDPAPVTITLGGSSPFDGAIKLAYDGAPQSVADDVTTSPAGVPVTINYNGSTAPPTLPGTYHVVVTSNDPHYAGVVEGTIEITVTALVRHAPSLNGDIVGSLQLLSGESFAVNNGVSMFDLLAPGTPTVQLNGKPMLGGVVDAAGATAPTTYSVTLNHGAVVRYVMRRVDPIDLPVVTEPALPAGTRSVTLTGAGQNFGAAITLRNLTLSAKAGAVAVPAGVYGNFAVNASNTLVLGVEGATVPAVYELQSLTIGHNASVKIVGPITLKLASGLSLDGPLGSAAHPDWLDLQIASGGLTVNGGAAVHGVVSVPNDMVIINGSIRGRVSADRLTINGSGVLEDSAF